MKKTFTLLLLSAISILACGDDADGKGNVAFTTYGEDYIEKAIPAADVEDGWDIRFSKFLIVLSDVAIAESLTAAPTAKMVGSRLFDMHVAGAKTVFSASDLPARPYTHVSFVVAPVRPDTALGEGATDADKTLMAAGGYSVYVAGSMAKGGVTKTFTWGFTSNTLYDRCEGNLGGKLTEGVVVTNGGTDQVELTIHGDHFFYDDLQSPDAKVRGDNVAAADRDADGAVTLEELAQVELASLPKSAGTYGTGGAPDIRNLRTFVEGLARTLGHFRGEGECFAIPR